MISVLQRRMENLGGTLRSESWAWTFPIGTWIIMIHRSTSSTRHLLGPRITREKGCYSKKILKLGSLEVGFDMIWLFDIHFCKKSRVCCRSRSVGPQGGLFCQETVGKLTYHHYPSISTGFHKKKCVGPTFSISQLDVFSCNQLWKTSNGSFLLTHQLYPATTVGVCKPCLPACRRRIVARYQSETWQVCRCCWRVDFFHGT